MVNRIGWCDETWNPMIGCTPVSEACEHCYARAMNARFGCPGGDKTFRPHVHPERLDKPLHWRKPRRIFVCSMSDLFHEAFTNHEVERVIVATQAAPQHTYLILTKRPERMRNWIAWFAHRHGTRFLWPLPNVHLGVTVENQARADDRIPILIDTPAAVRFVCCEPLLGAVDIVRGYQWAKGCLTDHYKAPVDWVIVGGENGPGARPMHPEWALDLYCQCKAAGVAFWWKGSGSKGGLYPVDEGLEMMTSHNLPTVTS